MMENPMKSTIFGIMETCNRDAGAVLRTPAGVAEHRGRMSDVVTVSPSSKQCTRCGEVKPLTDYYRAKRGLYGCRSQCKRCISHDRNEYGKRMRVEHPEMVQKWYRDKYERDRDKILTATKAYAQAHPWQSRYKWRRLRAQEHGAAIIDLTTEQWWGRLDYFDHRCAYCHEVLTQDGQDHIAPLGKGGDHTLDNVVPACRKCNSAKLDRTLIESLMKGSI